MTKTLASAYFIFIRPSASMVKKLLPMVVNAFFQISKTQYFFAIPKSYELLENLKINFELGNQFSI
jgi:hypothetical protein